MNTNNYNNYNSLDSASLNTEINRLQDEIDANNNALSNSIPKRIKR
jgi:hypothetical protein